MGQTIDEVIQEMDGVVQWAREKKNRLGYFAALYRKVTVNVKNGIAAGRFEDGARMEKLDVIFANRYLDAWNKFQRGEKPSRAWEFAFQQATNRQVLILQHLLLGMNAHINLDLGIAAAQAAPGDQFAALQHDFDEINNLLAGLFDDVKLKIGTVSPMFHLAEQLTPDRDEKVLFNFSLNKARAAAWGSGQKFALLELPAQVPAIAQLDQMVTALAASVCTPNLLFAGIITSIALSESNDVPRVIDAISE